VPPIRANTVLPADRRPLRLQTADGLTLVGELALPLDRPPLATLLCMHPLPTAGGSMDSHLLRKAAWRLPALAGFAVLRINTRGTESAEGRSDGTFDGGESERYDVAAAIEYADFNDLPSPWLVGWSFGTDLVLRYGCDPVVCGGVLLSPPLRYSSEADLDGWAAFGRPLTAIVPEFDDNLQPDEARKRFARVPQARVVPIAGAYHLFVGRTEDAFDALVEAVLDGTGTHVTPLARDYDITTTEESAS
jgi:alpha/beta superfamily hydrolase